MLRDKALDIFNFALESVKPKNSIPKIVKLVENSLHVENKIYDLTQFKRVFVYGSGKAGLSMSKEIEKIFGDKLYGGVVVSPLDAEATKITYLKGTHPIPTKLSLEAGDRLLREFSSLNSDDFYIYLLSGGSSALIESLKDGISLEDLQVTTGVLLKNPLPIQTINSVRKKISNIKGGGLTSVTKAKGIVLTLSDVIGDDLHSIGSAPLMADKKPFDISDISADILKQFPISVQNVLALKDTTKEDNSPEHFFIGKNSHALASAKKKAEELGLHVEIVTDSLEGDVEYTTKLICEKLKSAKPNSCLLFGGESTVHVRGNGKGGRNQHMVLLALKELQGLKDFAVLSAGTDGIDGNSNAAGAVIDDNTTIDEIDSYLDDNDSYHFFKKRDCLVMTGATKTNVMDIMVVLKGNNL